MHSTTLLAILLKVLKSGSMGDKWATITLDPPATVCKAENRAAFCADARSKLETLPGFRLKSDFRAASVQARDRPCGWHQREGACRAYCGACLPGHVIQSCSRGFNSWFALIPNAQLHLRTRAKPSQGGTGSGPLDMFIRSSVVLGVTG
jgi:hypothetical protein